MFAFLCRKCSNVATVLYVWRPLFSQLWAALAARDAELTNAPSNCVWTKQIETSLCWIQSFIRGQTGAITRTYSFSAFFWPNPPWKLPRTLQSGGLAGSSPSTVSHWHISRMFITPEDEQMLNVKRGEPEGQQVFEGLALLVAVRLWAHLWHSRRVRLILRFDNVGALSIYSSVKGRSAGMNLLAR